MRASPPAPRPDDSTLRAELRAAGLRVTPARVAVLGAVRGAGRALSHHEVCEQLDGCAWDATTVYRNLVALVEAGLLRRIDHGDHMWRFEPLHDNDRDAVFECDSCGTREVIDEVAIHVPVGEVPSALRKGRVQITITGLCDHCDEPG